MTGKPYPGERENMATDLATQRELDGQLRITHNVYELLVDAKRDLRKRIDERDAILLRAEAAERERDEMAMVLDGGGWKRVRPGQWERQEAGVTSNAEARVAELEEALRQVVAAGHVGPDALSREARIARDALDRAKEESPFPKPKMVEIGEERASKPDAPPDDPSWRFDRHGKAKP